MTKTLIPDGEYAAIASDFLTCLQEDHCWDFEDMSSDDYNDLTASIAGLLEDSEHESLNVRTEFIATLMGIREIGTFNNEDIEDALMWALGGPHFDMVEHPAHYTGHPKGIECIDVIEDTPYPNLANVIKYAWRVSWGGKFDDIEDLEKCAWYVNREIARRKAMEGADA